jgi:ATP adenylyltransferase
LQETDDPRDGCIFCDLPAAGPEKHKENLILSCAALSFVILNRYPYNNGHLMVVPRRHVSEPSLLPEREYRILTELLRRVTTALWKTMNADGVNVGMNLGRTAGAGIDAHCHYHVVPRWNGDTNFMPVVGESKVISVSLEDSFTQLHDVIGELAAEVEEELG